MQTYTHLLIGGASAACFSNHPYIQLAWILGNIFPDVTVATQFIRDKLTGKKPLVFEPPGWVWIKNVCHSVFLGLVIFLYGANYPWISIFGAGIILHVVIDFFTHKSEDSNCNYGWPIRIKSYCIWSYQIGDGILRPRKPELVICILCIAVIIWNTLPSIINWW